jgi:glycosyltransferase involved in cell wall biosynthesis
LLTPWGNSEALALALGQILRDEDLAAELGAAARVRMRDFSFEREKAAWEDVYDEIIGL